MALRSHFWMVEIYGIFSRGIDKILDMWYNGSRK